MYGERLFNLKNGKLNQQWVVKTLIVPIKPVPEGTISAITNYFVSVMLYFVCVNNMLYKMLSLQFVTSS